MLRAAVLFLTGRYRHIQPILRWRQRTGRVFGEGTRGVVGTIEIEDHLAVLRQSRVEETRGAVGFLARRAVGQHKEQLAAWLFLIRQQLESVAVALEYGLAWHVDLVDGPQDRTDFQLVRRVERHPVG